MLLILTLVLLVGIIGLGRRVLTTQTRSMFNSDKED